MIYLDAAATTPVRREVLEAMWPYLSGSFGNPSSRHSLGEQAAGALLDARARVAAVLECRPSEVIFTSGGTEADNLAVKGIALLSGRGRRVVTTAIEHEAVLASCDYLRRHHGFTVDFLPLDCFGRIDLSRAEEMLTGDTALCTAMLANNEIGTVQPIAALAAMAHELGVPVHTDAVQAGGALDVRPKALRVDALSLSGHKLGAPKGVGVLFLRGRLPTEPVMHGGGQERGRRSGTENVAGAVGFALALEMAEREREERSRRLTGMRDALIRGVLERVPQALLTGDRVARLPNHASFCFPELSGEAMLLELERRGILCSSGSACAAGRDAPSHVLLAIGMPAEVAGTAVRFSLTETVTDAEIAFTVGAVGEAHEALRAIAYR